MIECFVFWILCFHINEKEKNLIIFGRMLKFYIFRFKLKERKFEIKLFEDIQFEETLDLVGNERFQQIFVCKKITSSNCEVKCKKSTSFHLFDFKMQLNKFSYFISIQIWKKKIWIFDVGKIWNFCPFFVFSNSICWRFDVSFLCFKLWYNLIAIQFEFIGNFYFHYFHFFQNKQTCIEFSFLKNKKRSFNSFNFFSFHLDSYFSFYFSIYNNSTKTLIKKPCLFHFELRFWIMIHPIQNQKAIRNIKSMMINCKLLFNIVVQVHVWIYCFVYFFN